MLTGASGSIGSQVAKKLLKAGVGKLVLCVREEDSLDPKIREMCDRMENLDRVSVLEMDFREAQRIVTKF